MDGTSEQREQPLAADCIHDRLRHRGLGPTLRIVSAPRRPLAPDTTLAAEFLLIEHYRGLEVHERIAIAMDLTRMADEIALEGIRERHPGASEREQKLRLAAL